MLTASTRAFGGNVELLVELRGRRARCGVEALFGGDGVTFRTLLDAYTPQDDTAVPTSAQELLEEQLDGARRALAVWTFTASVEAEPGDETYRLTLASARPARGLADVRGRVWPISLTDGMARTLDDVHDGVADFGVVPFDRLTSFFAIELTLHDGALTATTRFVVNATLVGAPANRSDRMLGRLLESREKVMRYLLLLLADDGFAADGSGPIGRFVQAFDRSDGWSDSVSVPLLESLLKTLARNPARLDQVGRAVASLRATTEGAALLPERFDEVWAAVSDARAPTP